jgi:hypothetical protein
MNYIGFSAKVQGPRVLFEFWDYFSTAKTVDRVHDPGYTYGSFGSPPS